MIKTVLWVSSGIFHEERKFTIPLVLNPKISVYKEASLENAAERLAHKNFDLVIVGPHSDIHDFDKRLRFVTKLVSGLSINPENIIVYSYESFIDEEKTRLASLGISKFVLTKTCNRGRKIVRVALKALKLK